MRDFWQFMTLALTAAIIADVLTHGQVAVDIAKIGSGLLTNALRIAAGQQASTL